MAQFPTITYSNVVHKVSTGVVSGVVQTADESITTVFNGGTGNTAYKMSYVSPYNLITGNFSSNKSLTKYEIRVNPIEEANYGPEIGKLAYSYSGILANTTISFSITISQAVFTGSPTNTYRVCLMAQSEADYSWDFTQIFMVIDTNTSFTNTYTEVEYLGFERDSNRCCIDSGVTMQQNYSIETCMMLTNTSSDNQFLFSDRSSSGGYFHVYINPSRYATYQTPNIGTVTMNLYQAYVFKKAGTSCYVDGTYYGVSGNSSQTTRTLLIGGVDAANGSCGFWGRCYYFKIWDGSNNLIRDFVPCIRNSDGKPGMYDRVNNVFYVNQGSGEFKYGPLKSVPQTYQQVEYIQNTAQQHIDTLVNGNNVNLKIYTEYEPTSNSQMAIFSARTSSSTGISFWTDGYCHFGNSSTLVSGVASTGKHKVELSKNGLYWDDTKLNFTAGTSMANSNLVLFRVLGDSRVFLGKIYNAKVYDNNILIRNLVPCYRKSDNVIGMLDMVNNVFYTNAGSGTFTKGNNVNNINYIKYKPTDYDGYDVHLA